MYSDMHSVFNTYHLDTLRIQMTSDICLICVLSISQVVQNFTINHIIFIHICALNNHQGSSALSLAASYQHLDNEHNQQPQLFMHLT